MKEGCFAGIHNMVLQVDMKIKRYTYISITTRDFDILASYAKIASIARSSFFFFLFLSFFFSYSALRCLRATMHQCHLNKIQSLVLKWPGLEAWTSSIAGSHLHRSDMLGHGLLQCHQVERTPYRPRHSSLGTQPAPHFKSLLCGVDHSTLTT